MRGAREFRNAVRAHARGAPVAQPLAFGVALRPRRGYESLLVYRLLPEGSRTLAELAWGRLPRERRAGTLAALARLTADLHERGVFHLDLTPMNVVRTGGSDAEPALVAVDLETIRLARFHQRALAARSLARLDERFAWASDAERDRFREIYRIAERRAVTPAVSVVMSTWERPAHLALALAGYLRQTGGVEFELLVADDGSGPETAAVVRRFAEQAPFPVQHVWHARDGHHRTAILNRAVARASGEQVLYTDGDCVPAADLVAVHRRELEPGKLLIGGYLRVPPRDRRRRRRRLGRARRARAPARPARAISPCCAATSRISGRSGPGAGGGRTISAST